ncbi:uncharacterized protein LOC135490756 [Lineus longissimus]|uniref:uncharacterized protein LOC135490756 n=1 Tax=Lineus longissimus TaxID=88925 RepID=UPI002B4D3D63
MDGDKESDVQEAGETVLELDEVPPDDLPALQRLLDSGLEDLDPDTQIRHSGKNLDNLDIELGIYTDTEHSSERRLLERELELVPQTSPTGEQTSLGDSQGRDTLRTSSDRSSSPRAKWESRRHGHGFLSSDSGFGADDSTDNAGQHSVMLEPKVTIKTGSSVSGDSRHREFPRPPKYLPLAILVSFGNPPLGLLAVMFSILTERDVRKGDLQEAKRKSKITMLTIIMAFAVTILTVVVALIVCTAQNKLPFPKYVVKPRNESYSIATSAPDVNTPEGKGKKKEKKMPAFLKSLVNLGGDPEGGDPASSDAGEPPRDTQEQPLIPQLPQGNDTNPFLGWKVTNGTLLDLRQKLFHK